MKRRRLKTEFFSIMLCAAVFSFVACQQRPSEKSSEVKTAGKSPGQLRGFQEMNLFFTSHIVKDRGSLLSYGLSMYENDLIPLLGTFSGTGVNNRYQNAAANATNVFILRAMLQGTSEKLAQLLNRGTDCELSGSFYQPEFIRLVKDYCLGPNKKNLEALWKFWIGIEHADKFEDWFADYQGIASHLSASEDDFFTIYYSFFMNPYFLFET